MNIVPTCEYLYSYKYYCLVLQHRSKAMLCPPMSTCIVNSTVVVWHRSTAMLYIVLTSEYLYSYKYYCLVAQKFFSPGYCPSKLFSSRGCQAHKTNQFTFTVLLTVELHNNFYSTIISNLTFVRILLCSIIIFIMSFRKV